MNKLMMALMVVVGLTFAGCGDGLTNNYAPPIDEQTPPPVIEEPPPPVVEPEPEPEQPVIKEPQPPADVVLKYETTEKLCADLKLSQRKSQFETEAEYEQRVIDDMYNYPDKFTFKGRLYGSYNAETQELTYYNLNDYYLKFKKYLPKEPDDPYKLSYYNVIAMSDGNMPIYTNNSKTEYIVINIGPVAAEEMLSKPTYIELDFEVHPDYTSINYSAYRDMRVEDGKPYVYQYIYTHSVKLHLVNYRVYNETLGDF